MRLEVHEEEYYHHLYVNGKHVYCAKPDAMKREVNLILNSKIDKITLVIKRKS